MKMTERHFPFLINRKTLVETPSQQGPKRKRRRIQLSYYLDDHNAHSKETIRSPPKKFPVKPYKYSMGEEEEY